MMLRKSCIYMILFFAHCCFSQPITSSAWFPSPGDSYLLVSTSATPDKGESGAGIVWDFSDLDLNENFTFDILFEYIEPEEIAGWPIDNFLALGANIAVVTNRNRNDETFAYYRKDDKTFSYLGVANIFDTLYYSNAQDLFFDGLRYGDSITDEYIRFNPDSGTEAIGKTTTIYDGYGSLLFPHIVYDTIVRFKQIDESYSDIKSGALTYKNSSITESYNWIYPGSFFPIARWEETYSTFQTILNGEVILEEKEGPEIIFAFNPIVDFSPVKEIHSLPEFKLKSNLISDFLLVDSEITKQIDYQIYNLEGIKITAGRFSSQDSSIDLSNLIPGIYFIQASGYLTQPFLKIP